MRDDWWNQYLMSLCDPRTQVSPNPRGNTRSGGQVLGASQRQESVFMALALGMAEDEVDVRVLRSESDNAFGVGGRNYQTTAPETSIGIACLYGQQSPGLRHFETTRNIPVSECSRCEIRAYTRNGQSSSTSGHGINVCVQNSQVPSASGVNAYLQSVQVSNITGHNDYTQCGHNPDTAEVTACDQNGQTPSILEQNVCIRNIQTAPTPSTSRVNVCMQDGQVHSGSGVNVCVQNIQVSSISGQNTNMQNGQAPSTPAVNSCPQNGKAQSDHGLNAGAENGQASIFTEQNVCMLTRNRRTPSTISGENASSENGQTSSISEQNACMKTGHTSGQSFSWMDANMPTDQEPTHWTDQPSVSVYTQNAEAAANRSEELDASMQNPGPAIPATSVHLQDNQNHGSRNSSISTCSHNRQNPRPYNSVPFLRKQEQNPQPSMPPSIFCSQYDPNRGPSSSRTDEYCSNLCSVSSGVNPNTPKSQVSPPILSQWPLLQFANPQTAQAPPHPKSHLQNPESPALQMARRVPQPYQQDSTPVNVLHDHLSSEGSNECEYYTGRLYFFSVALRPQRP